MKGGGAIGPMQQGSYPMGECRSKHPSRLSLAQRRRQAWPGKPRVWGQSSSLHPGGPYSFLCLGLEGGGLWAQVGITWEGPVPSVYPGMMQMPGYQPAMMPAPMPMMPAMGAVPAMPRKPGLGHWVPPQEGTGGERILLGAQRAPMGSGR